MINYKSNNISSSLNKVYPDILRINILAQFLIEFENLPFPVKI